MVSRGNQGEFLHLQLGHDLDSPSPSYGAPGPGRLFYGYLCVYADAQKTWQGNTCKVVHLGLKLGYKPYSLETTLP